MKASSILAPRLPAARAVVARAVGVGCVAAVTAACAREPAAPSTCFPTTVTVAPASRTLAMGDTGRFVALFGGCGEVDPVVWSTSSTTVATIVFADSQSVLVRVRGYGITSIVAAAVRDPHLQAAGLVVVPVPVVPGAGGAP
jgi:hypothetical protein